VKTIFERTDIGLAVAIPRFA